MISAKIYLFFILIILGSCNVAFATTYYTRGTGAIGGAIWSDVSTTGAGSVFSSLTALQNGDIIYIDDDITIGVNWGDWKTKDITIYLNSTITFTTGGILELSTNSVIIFQSSSANVVSSVPGNKISFGGGPAEWDGGDPPLTGPGSFYNGLNGALPVELLFFKGAKGSNKISLSWATASELNFDYFDIEKSSDGANFYSIANVKGNGTTNERHDYSLIDEKPMIGKNYYRLKSVDFDGYTEYFNVIMVDFDGKKHFSVYPNPSDGVLFTTETNFTPQSRAFVVVYTTLGSEVAHYEVSGAVSTITLPVKLESGVYYAKYISLDFNSTNRLLVK